jgi:hypothetical protein
MTKEEMLDRISSFELCQWRALYELEEEDQDGEKNKNSMMNSMR